MSKLSNVIKAMRYLTVVMLVVLAWPSLAADNSPSTPDYLQMVSSLIVVLGLIFFLAFVAKKMRLGPSNQQGVKLVANLTLGTKERIIVVEVEEQQYLLGVTAHQINLIQTLPQNITKAKPLEQNTNIPFDILSLLKKGK